MSEERPIDASRPIVDPHHHLWDFGEIAGMGTRPGAFLLRVRQRYGRDERERQVR